MQAATQFDLKRLTIICTCFFSVAFSTWFNNGATATDLRGWLPEVYSNHFNYHSNVELATITAVKNTDNYQMVAGTLKANDPQHNGEYHIEVQLYRTKKNKAPSTPWVIQLPPLGSGGMLEEIVANHLAAKGISTVVVVPDQNPTTLTRTIEDTDPFFIRNTVSVRQAIDYFSRFSFLDPNRIGSFGVSLGGIRSGYLLPVEKRIKKGVIIIGGGNLPNILAYSQETGVTKFRNAKMKEHGFKTQDQFRDAIRKVHYLDSLDMAPFVETHRAAMVIASFDTMVPKNDQMKLFESLGKPNHMIIPTEHMTSAFFIGPILDFTTKQFQAALK